MARKAAQVDKNELFQSFKQLMKEHDQYDLANGNGPFSKVSSDLKKVGFDAENFDFEGKNLKYPLGPQNIKNLSFIGCQIGGDWQYPLYFLIYLDQNGKTLRAYIPEAGNAWNKTLKQAYGDDEEKDIKDMQKLYKKINPTKNISVDELEKYICNLIVYWDGTYKHDLDVDNSIVDHHIEHFRDYLKSALEKDDPTTFTGVYDAEYFVDNKAMFAEIEEHISVVPLKKLV